MGKFSLPFTWRPHPQQGLRRSSGPRTTVTPLSWANVFLGTCYLSASGIIDSLNTGFPCASLLIVGVWSAFQAFTHGSMTQPSIRSLLQPSSDWWHNYLCSEKLFHFSEGKRKKRCCQRRMASCQWLWRISMCDFTFPLSCQLFCFHLHRSLWALFWLGLYEAQTFWTAVDISTSSCPRRHPESRGVFPIWITEHICDLNSR